MCRRKSNEVENNSGLKPVLYLSKKEALNIARRQMQKEEQEENSIFYPKGKETTDDEA